ncbi:phosphonate ABC transporter substrate-binding protein [Massilia sp. W12]|uniref:phosphonate ABC transporter substrate-binding protein n=1 Tax=Massilia sp. W12 TaxID=3126507 RepID=UPI0030CE9634
MNKPLMAIGALLLASTMQLAQAADKITMALISTQPAEETRKDWKPLLEDMGKQLGVPVDVFVSTNYADVVSAVRDGRAQVAWLSGKLALEAVEGDRAQVFAQVVKKDGSQGYKSVLITPASSNLRTLDDVVAKKGEYTFMNGDPKSTSGFLVPSYYAFSLKKVNPDSHFKKVLSGNHQKNFVAVAKGEVDLATNNTEDMERLEKEMPEDFKKVRVIWTSPQIPNDPLIYRTDLPESMKNKVEKFFLSYGKSGAGQQKVLGEILKLSGFRKSSNAQLIPIADLELFSQLRRNQDDEKKSPAEKQKTAEALMARFGSLSALLTMDRMRSGK